MIAVATEAARKRNTRLVLAIGLSSLLAAHAAPGAVDDGQSASDAGSYSFAILGSVGSDNDRAVPRLLRAVGESPARFLVHFDQSTPSRDSCADAAVDRRRALLDTSVKPAIPVLAASEWADCGSAGGDPMERLARIGDLLFAGDQSFGQSRLRWLRQSAVPRFHRYRENLRWQVGRVLFATMNLPDNNNDFRIAAGRNGEFEERLVANRAWIERTFRIAAERRLAGIVLFVDAAPRFSVPMRAPDTRSRDRDGYYEWKLALRESVARFNGQVLLVQGRYAADLPRPNGPDRPLRDAAGHVIRNLTRIALPEGAGAAQWMRVEVDSRDANLFHIETERLFDDPTGELYGR